MDSQYDFYTMLTAPAFYALISSLILNLRFSYIEPLFPGGIEKSSVILVLMSIVLIVFMAIVFPFRIGYAVSEIVDYNNMLKSSLSAIFYCILTLMSTISVAAISSKFVNSPYIISTLFLVDTSHFFGSGLSLFLISLLFILSSTFSAFIGAFKQLKSMK